MVSSVSCALRFETCDVPTRNISFSDADDRKSDGLGVVGARFLRKRENIARRLEREGEKTRGCAHVSRATTTNVRYVLF